MSSADYPNNPKRDEIEAYNAFRREAMGEERYEKAVAKGKVHDPQAVEQAARKRYKSNEKERKAAKREAQIALVLAEDMLNIPRDAIAKKFNLSNGQVTRLLNEGHQKGYIKLAQDIIAGRLLPKAIGVYDQHLDEGNLEAARDVVRGTGALPDKPPAIQGGAGGEITIREIRARLEAGQSIRDVVEAADAAIEGVIERGTEHRPEAGGNPGEHEEAPGRGGEDSEG